MAEQTPDVIFPNIGIELQNLPHEAFSILGLPIYYYGVLICLGILAGLFYAVREAGRTGQDPELYTNFAYYVIIASIVGARIYYVIFSWDTYKNDLIKIFATREGGLAIYGGVIAAVITAVIYTKKRKLDFWQFTDTAAPGLILGQAIGRWGNFFNREAFGGFTDSFFAMQYLTKSVPYVPKSVAEHIIYVNGVSYIQVHPAFLYESLWCLFVFLIMNIRKKNKKAAGEIFAIYLVGYGFGRFFIEGLRTDQLLIWGGNIAVSQAVSIILIILGFLLLYKQLRQNSAQKL